MTLGKILIIALLPHVLHSGSERCPYWKDIVRSQVFAGHLLQVTKMTDLHVGMPPEFGEEETRLLTNFLKATPLSVRLFTYEESLSQSVSPCTELHAVLPVMCRETVWMEVIVSRFKTYQLHLHVFCANSSAHSTVANHLIDATLAPLSPCDVFNFTVRNQQILLGRYDGVSCLNCTTDHENGHQFKLVRDLPLKRNLITIRCEYPYFCKTPSIKVLKDIIHHRNTSVKLKQFWTKESFEWAVVRCQEDPKSLLYFNWVFAHHHFFPYLSPVQHYESLGYEYYVKGPVPLLREVVLLLPLSAYVWIAVLASFALSLLTCSLIFKVIHVKTKVFSFVSVLFLSSLLQRSYPVPLHITQLTSFRIIFGACFSTVTIISTQYIGVLTSLLANVPMSGTLPEFTPNSTPISQGFRLCTLTYPLDEAVKFSVVSRHKFGAECMTPTGEIHIGSDGKDVFRIFGSGISKPDKLKNELSSRGYVRTSSDTSAIVNGPQMKSTSPYRAQLKKIVGRAFEAGLFLHACQMAEFHRTRRHVSHIDSDPLKVELLGLRDLRPCFVILGVGLCLCGLALFCELIAW